MQQVADAIGVHQTTVSLALRHHPGIPQATRERVLKAAKAMGYRPNPLVSTLMSELRSKRRRKNDAVEVIAYINTHEPATPIYRHFSLQDMFAGVQQGAHDLGFALEVFNLRDPDMTGKRLRKILISRGIRAIIISPMQGDCKTIDIDVTGFAAVALGIGLQSPILERVASDHYQCMQLAFRNCMRLGYRRIGLNIDQTLSTRLEDRWLAAFLCCQQMLPPACRVSPLLEVMEVEEPKIVQWLKRERPDVIISPLSRWWRKMQRNPMKIPIVNLTRLPDDAECAGINQNMYKIGRISVERAVSRLHHNDFGELDEAQNTLLHGTWTDGSSLPPKAENIPPKKQTIRNASTPKKLNQRTRAKESSRL